MKYKPMQYKGYTASVEFSEEEKCYVGDVLGISDVIFFRGDTQELLNQQFKEMIDEYLTDSAEDNIEPCIPPLDFIIPVTSEPKRKNSYGNYVHNLQRA